MSLHARETAAKHFGICQVCRAVLPLEWMFSSKAVPECILRLFWYVDDGSLIHAYISKLDVEDKKKQKDHTTKLGCFHEVPQAVYPF
eukprot:1157108-Pelagomonas_calceolata.AAC.10